MDNMSNDHRLLLPTIDPIIAFLAIDDCSMCALPEAPSWSGWLDCWLAGWMLGCGLVAGVRWVGVHWAKR